MASGIKDLEVLLAQMDPKLCEHRYVFCTVQTTFSNLAALEPWALIREEEGTTILLELTKARQAGLTFEAVFRRISLSVHSSLTAVGLTAAVAARLAEQGISANVVAGYYHDHIFVPEDRAEQALWSLQKPADSGSQR